MAHLKRNIHHLKLEGPNRCFSQDIKRSRCETEVFEDASLSCKQKNYLKKPHFTYPFPSCKPADELDSIISSGRKRTLFLSIRDNDSADRFDLNTEANLGLDTFAKVSQDDSKSSNDLMPYMSHKRPRPSLSTTMDKELFLTDISRHRSILPGHGINRSTVISGSSSSLSPEMTNWMSIMTVKSSDANVDSVIGMLQCKMKSIYESEIPAKPTMANYAESSCQNDADFGLSISDSASVTSNVNADPIFSLSCRLRSILLQSPYTVS